MLACRMHSGPRKLSNDEALYTSALRALVRRAHSVFEMRTYLERRTDEPAAAKRVLARLREQQMVDDARYALDFARSRANLRRQGRFRIAQELRRRGVADQYIDPAVAQVFTETDEVVLVRKVIERRIRAVRGPFDERKRASVYRALLRAGFDAQLIQRELREAAKTARAEAASEEVEEASADFPEA